MFVSGSTWDWYRPVLPGDRQRGDVTCPGSATVALPSRQGGSEVVLPDAPEEFSTVAQSLLARHNELKAEGKTSA